MSTETTENDRRKERHGTGKIKKSSGNDLTNEKECAILFRLPRRRGQKLGVAQLVARYLGVVEAARSSRVTQTK